MKPLNLNGKQFGHLTVIEATMHNGVRKQKCICECGKVTYIKAGSLRAKNNTSCGCRIGQIAKNNKKWKGCGRLSGYIWAQIKWAASIRKNKEKKKFQIKIDTAWLLYEKQQGKCAISGLAIDFAKTGNDHRRGLTTASLDRIDSSKGYIDGNVQWVHKDINKLKTDFSQVKFIELCCTIYNHQKAMSKVEKLLD